MTDQILRALPRPAPAADPGALDGRFHDLVEDRFRDLLAAHPLLATFHGIHEADDQLGDGTAEVVLHELETDRHHLTAIETLDVARLSPEVRFERDLEIHNLRQAIFEADEVRLWARRSQALDAVGDGLFLLFARDHAPLADRLESIAGRLEATPAFLEESRTRALDQIGRAHV